MGWSWSPWEGRWRPEHGLPVATERFSVDTQVAGPKQAYDYWRNTAFFDFDPDRPSAVQRQNFSGAAAGLVSTRGLYYRYDSDAVSGARTPERWRADGYDGVTVGLALAGQRTADTGLGPETTTRRGRFFAYDAGRPARVDWTAHRGANLLLPRALATSAIGGDVPEAGELGRRLTASPLAPFLRSQMQQLARHEAVLNAEERSAALGSVIDLALAALRSSFHNTDPARGRSALLGAAKAFIDDNLSRPDLDAAMLAQALGISRSALYRLFSGWDQSVAAAIRAARLTEARRLLIAYPERPIAEIAASCGLLDAPHFARMFRAQFDIGPGELREEAFTAVDRPRLLRSATD